MQGDPAARVALGAQFSQLALGRIEAVGVDAAAPEGREHGRTAQERNLAFGRAAAQEHRDTAELGRGAHAVEGAAFMPQAHQGTSPTMRTSGTSRTPCTRRTVSRTWLMSSSMSVAVA